MTDKIAKWIRHGRPLEKALKELEADESLYQGFSEVLPYAIFYSSDATLAQKLRAFDTLFLLKLARYHGRGRQLSKVLR